MTPRTTNRKSVVKYRPGTRFGRSARTIQEVLGEVFEEQYHRIFDKLYVPGGEHPLSCRQQDIRELRDRRTREALDGDPLDSDFEHRR